MNLYNTNNTIDMFSTMANEVSNSTASAILKELNDLVSRGLLVIELGEGALVHDYSRANSLQYCQKVKVVLKDKEYIEKIEAENKELKDKINALQEAVNGLKL